MPVGEPAEQAEVRLIRAHLQAAVPQPLLDQLALFAQDLDLTQHLAGVGQRHPRQRLGLGRHVVRQADDPAGVHHGRGGGEVPTRPPAIANALLMVRETINRPQLGSKASAESSGTSVNS